jgi:hypothetical protein
MVLKNVFSRSLHSWCSTPNSRVVLGCNNSLPMRMKPRLLRPKDRAGAHYAGLQGYVQRTFWQVLAIEVIGRCADGQDFGVRSYVQQLLGGVVPACDDAVLAYHHCPYRDLAQFTGFLRLAQGLAHEVFVGFVL